VAEIAELLAGLRAPGTAAEASQSSS